MLAALLGGARRDSTGAADPPGSSGEPDKPPPDMKGMWARDWPNFAIVALVLVAGAFAWHVDSALRPATSADPPCANVTPPPDRPAAGVVIADAGGAGNTIDTVVPRKGGVGVGRSGPLRIQGDATLPPGALLATNVSELRRQDGEVLPETQVGSRASVARNGREVTVVLCVAPRFGQVSGFGKYTGAVALDDPRARGASVPVTIHVQYPYINRVLFWTLLAAIGGLSWTWLIRHGDAEVTAEPNEPGGRTLGIRLAAMLVAAPVVVTLVLDNRDWRGDLSSYVALATAAGAAVIAAAPTLRALASHIQGTSEEQKDQVQQSPNEERHSIGA
jgi:hypothetical protein